MKREVIQGYFLFQVWHTWVNRFSWCISYDSYYIWQVIWIYHARRNGCSDGYASKSPGMHAWKRWRIMLASAFWPFIFLELIKAFNWWSDSDRYFIDGINYRLWAHSLRTSLLRRTDASADVKVQSLGLQTWPCSLDLGLAQVKRPRRLEFVRV